MQEIAESGDLGFDGYIAFQCIYLLGIKSTTDILDRSVLGIARKMGLPNSIGFTEYYFYEEILFVVSIILELEDTKQYMQHIISLYENAFPDQERVATQKVSSKMLGIMGGIARERMRHAGITSSLDVEECVKYEDIRIKEYVPYIQEHVSCVAEIPGSGLSMGLEPRDHPLKKYLGVVSDNFCRVLNIESNNLYQVMLVQNSVMIIYSTLLEMANKITSKVNT